MKKYFFTLVIIFVLGVIAASVRCYFMESDASFLALTTYYFVFFTIIELFRCLFKYLNRRNRKKLNMTETEEEKAVLDSLGAQIKPFRSDENDTPSEK